MAAEISMLRIKNFYESKIFKTFQYWNNLRDIWYVILKKKKKRGKIITKYSILRITLLITISSLPTEATEYKFYGMFVKRNSLERSKQDEIKLSVKLRL